MKTMKKVFAMLLAVLMVGALSCTAWADQGDDVTLDNLESFREDVKIVLDMEMSFMGEGEPMQMKMESTMDVTLDPECTFMDMTAESGGETQHSLSYAVKDGDKYVIYMSTDEGVTWEKEEMDTNTSGMGSVGSTDALKLIAGYAEKFEKTGTDEFHGRKADIYEGKLSGDELKEFMATAGGLDSLLESFSGAAPDGQTSAFVGEMPIAIALDQKTGMVLGYAVDMGEFMQNMMESMMAAIFSASMEGEEVPEGFDLSAFLTININEVKSECVLYDFNQVDAIQLPKAA